MLCKPSKKLSKNGKQSQCPVLSGNTGALSHLEHLTVYLEVYEVVNFFILHKIP